MTIDEALTDLSIQLEMKRRLIQPHQADAILLGIEALKVIKHYREIQPISYPKLLPGETEE